LPLPVALQEPALRRRLEAIKREVDRPARDAVYQFETGTVLPEEPGQSLDVAASLDAIRRALRQGRPEAALIVHPMAPAVRGVDLAQAGQHQLARFTTPILAADPGRVQNISIALRKISGTALKPGQVFSFNGVVGPRDAAHGWRPAKELYQGEFVLGYGGGICQVSSTLYNAVLLAGLEVAERYHHDRPLQYIAPGRDATVAWEVLDFRFRNNTHAPILIRGQILPGSPRQIEIALYGPRPPAGGVITLETADVQYLPPVLEEVLDPTLPAGVREVVDEGHAGIEVKTYRIFDEGGRRRRELVSADRYQPKPGKVRVGVGNAPGSERLLQPGVR
jgi:vancomycin resistance protein YoaR